MSYSKFLVDNTSCSRRFHISFDDQAEKLPHVEVKCPFCEIIIFSADDHPRVILARQENLVQTAQLSSNLVKECDFSDPFKKTKQNQTTGQAPAGNK